MTNGEYRDLMAYCAFDLAVLVMVTGLAAMATGSIPLTVVEMVSLAACLYCGARFLLTSLRINRQVDAEMRRWDAEHC